MVGGGVQFALSPAPVWSTTTVEPSTTSPLSRAREKVGWLRHRTRRVGQFAYRTLLPGHIDTEHITADLADGVLTVHVPKAGTAKPRRITVNAT